MGGQEVGGKKLLFVNDLAVTQDGKKVYFTSSSSRWQRRDYLHLIMEATADGRYGKMRWTGFGAGRSQGVGDPLLRPRQGVGVRHGERRSQRGHGQPAIPQRDPVASRRGVRPGGGDHHGPNTQVRQS